MQRQGASNSEDETKKSKSSTDKQRKMVAAASSSRPNLSRNPQPTVDPCVPIVPPGSQKIGVGCASSQKIRLLPSCAADLESVPLQPSPSTNPGSDKNDEQRITRSRAKEMKKCGTVLSSVSRCKSPSSASLSSQTSSNMSHGSKSTSSSSNKDTLVTSQDSKTSTKVGQIRSRLAKSQISPTSSSSSSNTESTRSKSSPAKASTSSGDKSITPSSSSRGKSEVSRCSTKSTKSSRNPNIPAIPSSQSSSFKVIVMPESQSTSSGIANRTRRKAIVSYNSDAADAVERKLKEGDQHGYTNLRKGKYDAPPEAKTIVETIHLKGKDKPVSL